MTTVREIDAFCIRPGDLIFFRDNTLLSKAIRLVSTGKFNQDVPSHVAIAYKRLDKEAFDYMTLEATFSVRFGSLLSRPKATIWVMRLKDAPYLPEALRWAEAQVGRGYDYTALVGILLRSFWRLAGPWWYEKSKTVRNLLESKTRFFCSEYGFEFCRKVTGRDPWNSIPAQTTPYDLYRSGELNLIKKMGVLYEENSGGGSGNGDVDIPCGVRCGV